MLGEIASIACGRQRNRCSISATQGPLVPAASGPLCSPPPVLFQPALRNSLKGFKFGHAEKLAHCGAGRVLRRPTRERRLGRVKAQAGDRRRQEMLRDLRSCLSPCGRAERPAGAGSEKATALGAAGAGSGRCRRSTAGSYSTRRATPPWRFSERLGKVGPAAWPQDSLAAAPISITVSIRAYLSCGESSKTFAAPTCKQPSLARARTPETLSAQGSAGSRACESQAGNLTISTAGPRLHNPAACRRLATCSVA